MRRVLIALIAVMLLLPVCGLADTVRYPDMTGAVTDAAGVLSDAMKADLLKLQSELEDEDEDADFNLHIVTVDFLDGQSVQSYADALFSRAKLGKDDMLLLIAAGEDSYAVTVGKKAGEAFSQANLQSRLISTGFANGIAAQRYDEALSVFFTDFVKDAREKLDVKLSGELFGQTAQTQAAQAQGTSYSQMLGDLITNITTDAQKYVAQPVKNVTSKGLTPAGWVVLVLLILLVFSQSDPARKVKKNGCTGCGCAPFSKIFSALGIAAIINSILGKGQKRK